MADDKQPDPNAYMQVLAAQRAAEEQAKREGRWREPAGEPDPNADAKIALYFAIGAFALSVLFFAGWGLGLTPEWTLFASVGCLFGGLRFIIRYFARRS